MTLKKIKLLFTFYSSYMVAAMVITACCVYLIWKADTDKILILSILLWFKLITMALIYFFMNEYKKKEYFYYQNLGVTKLLLWTTTLSFDLTVFLLTTVAAHNIK